MKNYTVVDTFNGMVRACSKEEATDLSHAEEFFVITPEGNWLIGGEEQEVVR